MDSSQAGAFACSNELQAFLWCFTFISIFLQTNGDISVSNYRRINKEGRLERPATEQRKREVKDT